MKILNCFNTIGFSSNNCRFVFKNVETSKVAASPNESDSNAHAPINADSYKKAANEGVNKALNVNEKNDTQQLIARLREMNAIRNVVLLDKGQNPPTGKEISNAEVVNNKMTKVTGDLLKKLGLEFDLTNSQTSIANEGDGLLVNIQYPNNENPSEYAKKVSISINPDGSYSGSATDYKKEGNDRNSFFDSGEIRDI